MKDKYILNTKTGILHTKYCADGGTGQEPVLAGSRQHFSNLDRAKEHNDFIRCHNHKDCLAEEC